MSIIIQIFFSFFLSIFTQTKQNFTSLSNCVFQFASLPTFLVLVLTSQAGCKTCLTVIFMQCHTQCRTSARGCWLAPKKCRPMMHLQLQCYVWCPLQLRSCFSNCVCILISYFCQRQHAGKLYSMHDLCLFYSLSVFPFQWEVPSQSRFFAPKCYILNDTFPCLSSWLVITPSWNFVAKRSRLFL